MLFGRSRTGGLAPRQDTPLLPYAFRLGDSYVVGVAVEPGVGSPCAHCVELWLKSRELKPVAVATSELPYSARDAVADALVEGTPHVTFEVARDGSVTRLDSVLFPHPDCDCRRERYVGPTGKWTKRTNFVLSPIHRLEAARYGTPEGNLWLARATGNDQHGHPFSVTGGGRDREQARFAAVDRWLLENARKNSEAEAVRATSFPAGLPRVGDRAPENFLDGLGAGPTEEAATLAALEARSRRLVLRQYAVATKMPMLMVGTQNWLRMRVPFFLLQRYDVHLLFYPNAHPTWVVGVAALCRKGISGAPVFAFGSGPDVTEAIDKALFDLVDRTRPNDPFLAGSEEAAPPTVLDATEPVDEESIRKAVRQIHWWNHWIYRCPKLSLQDALHLENYNGGVERWREFYRDGMPELSVETWNDSTVPSALRRLVRVTPVAERLTQLIPMGGVGMYRALRLGEPGNPLE